MGDFILFQAWRNRNQIMEGLKNKVLKDEFVERVAGERYKVCKECPHIDAEGKKCTIPGTQPCCGLCGCSLSVKLRSLSTRCADEDAPRWLPVITPRQEDELDKLK
jgi:hypothetical protein